MQTRHLSLSLGGRACLALAISLQLPVYTGEKIWTKLKSDVSVHLIR
jgi:PIN domain nuclease of toxin-antitoxin system